MWVYLNTWGLWWQKRAAGVCMRKFSWQRDAPEILLFCTDWMMSRQLLLKLHQVAAFSTVPSKGMNHCETVHGDKCQAWKMSQNISSGKNFHNQGVKIMQGWKVWFFFIFIFCQSFALFCFFLFSLGEVKCYPTLANKFDQSQCLGFSNT